MKLYQLKAMWDFFNKDKKLLQPKVITHDDHVETCLIDEKGNRIEVLYYPVKETKCNEN